MQDAGAVVLQAPPLETVAVRIAVPWSLITTWAHARRSRDGEVRRTYLPSVAGVVTVGTAGSTV